MNQIHPRLSSQLATERRRELLARAEQPARREIPTGVLSRVAADLDIPGRRRDGRWLDPRLPPDRLRAAPMGSYLQEPGKSRHDRKEHDHARAPASDLQGAVFPAVR